jgi:superfamily II DNA or RNA helicase
MADRAAGLDTIEHLIASHPGGTVALNIAPAIRPKVDEAYRDALGRLDRFRFWRDSKRAAYRPMRGLWLPQRRAVAFAHAYLGVRQQQAAGADGEAALVKMPTGTGKTAVIAVLACASPIARKTLIITPRAGLVYQMRNDLSYRFWGHIGAAYYNGAIHENLGADEIDRIRDAVHRGTLAPVLSLSADHYPKIWSERHQERQILVATFNALHLVLGLKPPPHRSMYGREARPVALSLQRLDQSQPDAGHQTKNVEAFRQLLKSVDLVIVDEGHYEPAYSWSQAVRAIGRPTIIFSATPYRNDYKYFQIEGNYVFNLPWKEAVDQGLVRDVRCEPPIAANQRGARSKKRHPASGAVAASPEKRFVAEFKSTLAALPEDKKAIVHAATFRSLKALQRAFFAEGEEAVLIHDAFTGDETSCPDLRKMPAKQREVLANLRFQHVRHTEDSDEAQEARVWLHQYKLMEGIDDSRFVEIWLYDALGSARQVVQQVGRAIRRPDLDDPSGERATIRGSSRRLDAYDGAPTVNEQTKQRWQDYLEYERYAAKHADVAFTAETQLVATLKRTAPEVQYIAGEFRGGHLLDQSPTMTAFLLPRRAVVCRVRDVLHHKADAISDQFLDALQADSMEAMLIEERFDIAAVPPPGGGRFRDVRLIRYLAWGTSPYLARHHIPEWRLGVMAMVRSGRYLFILDTEGVCIDYARVGLLSPEAQELKRLFANPPRGRRDAAAAGPSTRIVETSASGLDISELGLRAISVRKHALEEGYFDLAEASQIPTTVSGFGQLGRRTARRRLSFANSSVADATAKFLTVSDYVAWARLVGDTMANERIEPHTYFARFAREVRALDADDGIPRSILLDIWDLLDVSDDTREDRQWDKAAVEDLLSYDTCCEIVEMQEDEDAPVRYYFTLGPYTLEIRYAYRDTIPPSGRYSISSEALNESVLAPDGADGDQNFNPDNRSFGRRLSSSLTRLINQEQAFRIIPSVPDVVYAHSHFYRPEVDETVLSVLEPSDALGPVVSEKGDTRLKKRSEWSSTTLFGLVYGWLEGRPVGDDKFAKDIRNCTVVICDDRNDETADFYGIDETARRVLIVHAKAEDGTPGISARKLQEVTRQAQASLAFAGSSRRRFEFPDKWTGKWSVKLKHAGYAEITKPRLMTSGVLDIRAAHAKLIGALANPHYMKDVIMLTSGILSASAAKTAQKSSEPRDLQFLYYLASVRSTFDRAGVRYRIVCNE